MKSSTKKPAPKNKKAISKKTLALALLLLIIGVGAFTAYRIQQNNTKKEQAFQADKARFAQVEADMKVAYDAMVASAGEPESYATEKGCGRTSAKFENGTLICNVDLIFMYKENDAATASSRYSKVKSNVKLSSYAQDEKPLMEQNIP